MDYCPECGAEEPYWNAGRAFDKQDELRAEIDRLRAALKPFAEWAEQNDDGEWSDDNDALDALTYADFRRAREALK